MLAHQMTFQQMENSQASVADISGYLIGGPDRRSETPKARFLAWQKAYQKGSQQDFSSIPQEVHDYFQATKHLTSPPGEPVAPKKFTWSPSKLMTFEGCPYKYAAESWYCTAPYEENAAAVWGTRVHKAAEDFMRMGTIMDLEGFEPVKQWCNLLAKVPGKRFIEHKIGVDEGFRAAEWDEAEGRMILDFGILKDDGSLLLIDFKTGKVKYDDFQLKVYCLMMAIQHPQVQKIAYKYIWVKTGEVTGGELTRAELLPVAKDLKERIGRIKEAIAEDNFRKCKSGLCKMYCSAFDCEHNGRRR